MPPVNPEEAYLVATLAGEIKSKYPDCSISTIVNLDTYNTFYNCNFINGLLVEPHKIIAKLGLIIPGYFDVALFARKSIFWSLLASRAKIKFRKNISKSLNKKDFNAIVDLLSLLNL